MQQSTRKIQIGVMGSAADLKYTKEFERLAEDVGYWVAKKGATLLFGAEKDYDSLSAAASRGAKRAGGLTVGVTYGKGLDVLEKNVDVVIASGLERGGGREFPLVLSCDAVIAIAGGSGTLTEIAIAYQANIPIVVLEGSGGWSEKLAGQYLDSRRRIKIEIAQNPKEAVEKAIVLTLKRPPASKEILFLAAVHGDENIGADVMRRLENDGYLQNAMWIIANERAAKRGVRFIDADLNRSAPGEKNAKEYESCRAYELMQIAKNYRYVLDLHGTRAKTGIFTIVTNPKWENLLLAAALPPQRIVIWASRRSSKSGPITRFVPCGVEIECGPQKDKTIQEELAAMLEPIVQNGITLNSEFLDTKEYFRVYGRMEKKDIPSRVVRMLRDFQKTALGGEVFYPLLVGAYEKIICYKMEKINLWEQFAY